MSCNDIKTWLSKKTQPRVILSLRGTLNKTLAAKKILALCPEHPKRDQNPKFTPLNETMSIPRPSPDHPQTISEMKSIVRVTKPSRDLNRYIVDKFHPPTAEPKQFPFELINLSIYKPSARCLIAFCTSEDRLSIILDYCIRTTILWALSRPDKQRGIKSHKVKIWHTGHSFSGNNSYFRRRGISSDYSLHHDWKNTSPR